jgi:uncharacterized protein YllA (UPF0747 family)
VQPEVRYEELPEIPGIWIDFLDSRLSFRPGFEAVKGMESPVDLLSGHRTPPEELSRILLRARADSPEAEKNMRRLQKSQAGAVIANCCASLLGGPMFQLLKCLTAIKICDELEMRSVPAVPLCWVSNACPGFYSNWSITLPDHDAEIHHLQLRDFEKSGLSPRDPLPGNEVLGLISQIEEAGGGAFDGETLEALRSVYVSESTVSSASARLISDLMGRWGMIVLDAEAPELEAIMSASVAPVLSRTGSVDSPFRNKIAELDKAGYIGSFDESVALSFIRQNSLLPVLACVLDPMEVYSYAATLPVLEKSGLTVPIAWPQASATLVDARSRRILERYKLDLARLFSGEEEIIKTITSRFPSSAAEKLDSLKLEVERCIAGLKALDIPEHDLRKAAVSHQGRILYQLERLRRLTVAGHERRELAVNRRIRRVCNLLTPSRRLQEREFSGIHIPLRYSRDGLRFLSEKIDIRGREHQLIAMD